MSVFPSRPIPAASFASIMGIVGLGLAWRVAANTAHAPAYIGEGLILIGAIVFVGLLGAWIARTWSRPAEIRAESRLPTTASYFGAIAIAVSLLAAGAVPYCRPVAIALYAIAAATSALLLIYFVGKWIEHGIEASQLTPAVLLLIVGNATTVFSAAPLGLSEFGWASFSFATLCWLTFGPLILYRLFVTEPRISRKMAPQIAILVSSPAVLASAWFLLGGGTADAVFKILAFKALFFALLTVRLWRVAWGEPYNLAMWGWTFPSAALAVTFERASQALGGGIYGIVAILALFVATVIVVACSTATLLGWGRDASGRFAR